MLLKIAHRQLHVEIVDVLFGDLFQPEENGFKAGQVGDQFYLPVQALQLAQRIQVIESHDAILHVYETFEKLARTTEPGSAA